MTNYKEASAYSIGKNAILFDKHNNQYKDEAMLLALLLHCKGKARGSKDDKDVRQLLNDPNL